MKSRTEVSPETTIKQTVTTEPSITHFFPISSTVILIFLIALSFLATIQAKAKSDMRLAQPEQSVDRVVSHPDSVDTRLFDQDLLEAESTGPALPLQSNQALIERVYAEIFNTGSLSNAEALFADTFYYYELGWPKHVRGLDSLHLLINRYRTTIPVLYYQLDNITVDDDLVIVRWTVSSRSAERFGPKTVSGRDMSLSGTTVWYLKDGKVLEAWKSMR